MRQVDLVYAWALNQATKTMTNGLLSVPPPIYSRIYQEMSNGMLGYSQAGRVASVAFPDILCKTSYFSMISMLTILPIVIMQFTRSYLVTPIITFGITFGFLMIHCVAIQLEAPYGEDQQDLPLLEIHTA